MAAACSRALHLALLAGVAVLGSCTQRYTQKDLEQRDGQWEESLEELRNYQGQLEVENAGLRARVASLEVDVERARALSAREASAQIDAAMAELEQAMRNLALASSGDLEYVSGPDGPVLRIRDRILFSSGSHQVTEGGRLLLGKLGTDLAGLGYPLRVEGHTDNQPVRVRAKDYPHGNLELSTARAIEVAALLAEAGVPAERISVTGYGEWRPIDTNDSTTGRSRNRRVEIAVVPSGSPPANR